MALAKRRLLKHPAFKPKRNRMGCCVVCYLLFVIGWRDATSATCRYNFCKTIQTSNNKLLQNPPYFSRGRPLISTEGLVGFYLPNKFFNQGKTLSNTSRGRLHFFGVIKFFLLKPSITSICNRFVSIRWQPDCNSLSVFISHWVWFLLICRFLFINFTLPSVNLLLFLPVEILALVFLNYLVSYWKVYLNVLIL